MTLRWLLSLERKVGAELTLTGDVRASDVVRLKQQIDWLIETMDQDAPAHDPSCKMCEERRITRETFADALPPSSSERVKRMREAGMQTGPELGGHMCKCGHCSHSHFKNHPHVRDGCSACNCTEFVSADASPAKEPRDGQ